MKYFVFYFYVGPRVFGFGFVMYIIFGLMIEDIFNEI